MVGASAIATLGLLVSLDGRPQQPSPAVHVGSSPPTVSRSQSPTPEQSKKLYATLFRQASPDQRRAFARALLTRKNAVRVVCGLTLLPADPSVDARMSQPLDDPTIEATIRKVEPTICRGDDESIR